LLKNKVLKHAKIDERKQSERQAGHGKAHEPKVKDTDDKWLKLATSKKMHSPGEEGKVLSKKQRRLAKQKGHEKGRASEAAPATASKHHETDDTQTKLSPGVRVSIFGLVASPELNGKLATCIRWEKALGRQGRWCVCLEDGMEKLVRPVNLKIQHQGEKRIDKPAIKQGALSVSPTVEQRVVTCLEAEKPALLLQLIQQIRQKEKDAMCPASLVLVVCNQVQALQTAASLLNQSQLKCASFNSETKQAKRDRALEEFHPDKKSILVTAGGVAAGVRNVHSIINYDFPESLEQYSQGSQALGQDGTVGTYYSFLTPDSAALAEGLVDLLRKSKMSVDQKLLKLSGSR